MKLSLKVQDEHRNPQSHHHRNPLLLRAKVPISVFGFPFLSGAAATVADSSDLSLSLRTSFASGPSLKLSYTPTSTNTVAAAAPLTLTLKSGVSLFGSPQNSPLIISARFSLSPQNPNPTPTFSLQIKPQLGDFSIRKTTYSSPNPNPKANGEVTSLGFVPLERPITLKDFTLDSSSKESFLSGIAVTAKTALPVTKRVAMNFRWGVNFPANIEKKLPFLTVNKIGIERVDEVKEVEAKSLHSSVDDLELLKCVSLSARRELEALQKENREIKQSLDNLRSGKLHWQEWTYQGHSDGVAKKASNRVAENLGEFEQWKNKKSWGKDNSCKESNENSNRASDVESELQRAILAASS